MAGWRDSEGPAISTNPIPSAAAEKARALVMSTALGALLDHVPHARAVLPFLGALEAALRDQGFAALNGVSAPVLTKMCSQLGALPLGVDDLALRDLLARLQAQRQAHLKPQAPSNLPGYGSDSVSVFEVSHDDFKNIEEQFQTGVFGVSTNAVADASIGRNR